MEIAVEGSERLRFGDGTPVRAASGLARLGDGFLVVQDDATHAAWCRAGRVTPVRLLPPVEGHDVFDEGSGTKHLKPDLEAACEVEVDGAPAVLVLGSGSSPARTRWSLLQLRDGAPRHVVADMSPLYDVVAGALSVEQGSLNLEGACLVDGVLRWFHRGLPSAGLPSGSVDLEPDAAVAAALGRTGPETLAATNPCHYALGSVSGVGLAVTDAVALPDGRVLASAAAEDSPNPRDDGPVVGAALALVDGPDVTDVAPLPLVGGRVCKVEGLMVLEADRSRARLLAVVDVDDPDAPSLAVRLRAEW